ncbi:MAG: AraC family transcriptional regulator [Phenylobacterium sp.]|nr:AraC family transcriptional regulator [Phenylobacterium sp.]
MDKIRTHHDCYESPRPIAALATELADGALVKAHHHAPAQLIHALSGVMTVRSPEGSWVVPTGSALWMPADTLHEFRVAGDVSMRTVFVKPNARTGLPTRCELIEVSPLLREAIVAATSIPLDYAFGGRDDRIMELILDELEAAPRLELHVPMPRDARLARLCERMIAEPSVPETLERLADELHMSSRTLARLFHAEIGMAFGEWRRRMRLMLSLSRLAAGASILQVALEHGYESPSAFAAMFRRSLGAAPSVYLASKT